MSRHTILLITVFLLVCSSLFITIKWYKEKSALQSPMSANKYQFPTPVPQCALQMEPTTVNTQPGKKTTINISIGSDDGYPTTVQLELAYDPRVLTGMTINPGSYFTNADILLNNIDQNTGRISYALQFPPGIKPNRGSGIVAALTFTPKFEAIDNQTAIYFLPKTSVFSNNQTSVIKSAYGAEILLPTPPNQATPSIDK